MSGIEYQFEGFPKIPRLYRDVSVTEKIDGTNAQILIEQDGTFLVASRKRWITPGNDNFGFAHWAYERKDELVEALGPGRHYGEWWGRGIQRGYGLDERRFSLFNTSMWNADDPPLHCHVVPVLYQGELDMVIIDDRLDDLCFGGSEAAPGFMQPEGVVVYHIPGNIYFKVTIEDDSIPKSA